MSVSLRFLLLLPGRYLNGELKGTVLWFGPQDPFGDHLKRMMKLIHDFMDLGTASQLREVGTQEYEADVVLLEQRGEQSCAFMRSSQETTELYQVQAVLTVFVSVVWFNSCLCLLFGFVVQVYLRETELWPSVPSTCDGITTPCSSTTRSAWWTPSVTWRASTTEIGRASCRERG